MVARLLLVEDERIIALDLADRLAAMGYEVCGTASSGERAIELAGELHPDLVLMDIIIQGELDGIQAAELIRTRLRLPVIFLTAHSDETTVRRARLSAPFGYLLKPFKEWEARTAIEIALYKHAIEMKLLVSEERFSLAVRGANDGIWDWDLLAGQVYYSPRWKAMLGYEEDEIGASPQDWLGRVHPEDLERVQQEIDAHLKGAVPLLSSEHRMLHKNGMYLWVMARGLAVSLPGQPPHRLAGSLSDITARKLSEQRLTYRALHDPLTGLPNRTLFLERLGHAFDRAQRKPDTRLAVLFLDLDKFKSVNDRLGHAMGDKLLQGVARRLENCIRLGDTAARLSGDEFAILLEDIAQVEDALAVAERIQASLERPFDLAGHSALVSASLGIALNDIPYYNPEDIVRDADLAMYAAKQAGRGGFQIFAPDLHAVQTARQELDEELHLALERGEFRLHYQPIIDLFAHRVVAMEALLRWQHPQRGLLKPVDFLLRAEDSGQIDQIGSWVLANAARQVGEWRSQVNPGLRLAVNLSVHQLHDPGFAAQVGKILMDNQLPAEALEVEITERQVVNNLDLAIEALSRLRDVGVRAMIDDFGSCYSTLDYLKYLPVKGLKIGQDFMGEMLHNPDINAISAAMIATARVLNLVVTAEGIESVRQLRCMTVQCCDAAQGYLFSQPRPPEEILPFLEDEDLLLSVFQASQ